MKQRSIRKTRLAIVALFAAVCGVLALQTPPVSAATAPSPTLSALPQLSQIQQWLKAGSQKTPLPKALASQLGSVTQSNFQNDPCRQMPSAEPRANGCVFGDLSSTKTVVLYGDSFAEQLIPALTALGSKDHFRVVAYARLGCPFANVTISNWLGTVDQGCATFRKNVITETKAMNPKPVLILLSELLQLNSPTNHAALIPVASFVNGVTKTLGDLTSTGLMTRVIIGVPQTSGLPATCLAKNLSNVAACALPPSTAYAKVHDAEIKAALTRIGVKAVNLGPLFCNGLCPVIAGNYFVHSDTVHLNAAYATATATGFGTLIGCSAAGYPRAWLTANPIFTTLLPTLSSATVQAQCQLANSAPLA